MSAHYLLPIALPRCLRRVMALWALLMTFSLVAWPTVAQAQQVNSINALGEGGAFHTPTFWYLLASSLALLVPVGFVLIAVAGLDAERAWNAALGGVGAIGLAAFGYWAIGFALHFGGIGLVYPQAELRQLVWEWSPLSVDWGIGWGMAGLSGWFLSGPDVTALVYALFLGHLPWVMTVTLLPVMALRGRAPATVTLLLALVIGTLVYPLAGNWVQGGGWLSALGRNLNLGHGLVDFGGAGTVYLVAAGFGLAALVVWTPRRAAQALEQIALPPAYQPLLAVVGSLLVLAGTLGWLWTNPLQVSAVGDLGLLRGSVNIILFASGGILVPLGYTWFVTGQSDPLLAARGLVAGTVAGLAMGPFVQPGVAFLIGLLAGATVPFLTFVIDGVLRLDDATGIVTSHGIPALLGLLFVGIFADGVVGAGWQMTGVESYLGVNGQGVSGLLVGQNFQADFPGQLQAQIVGILVLSLWGFLTGMLICVPLGLLIHGLTQNETWQAPPENEAPNRVNGFGFDELEQDLFPVRPEDRDRRGAA